MQDIKDCKIDSCLHGGKCIDLVNDYRCECRPGYQVHKFTYYYTALQNYFLKFILQGRNCEEDVDECAEHPCKVIVLRNYLYLFIFDIL